MTYFLTSKASSSKLQDTTDCSQSQQMVPCMFQAEFDHLNSRYCMALLGSSKGLGSWDRINAIVATYQGGGVWRARAELPVSLEIEYKWIIYDKILYEIIDYEPGDNRKILIGNKPVLIEDFDDGVQKMTEITRDELIKLVLMSKLSKVNEGKGANVEGLSQNKVTAYMPSGTGPFQYDESLVQQVKDLNPRIYVPEEYRTGLLKKSIISEGYEKTSQLDEEKENIIYRKPRLESSVIQHKSSDYGLEMAVIDVDKDENPRIYVPEEYKAGILKKNITSEGYEKTSQLDEEKENIIYRKSRLESSVYSDYGLEMAVIDVDKDAIEISRVNKITSDEAMKTDGNETWNNLKRRVEIHKDGIVKVGLFTGVAVFVMLLYKKLL